MRTNAKTNQRYNQNQWYFKMTSKLINCKGELQNLLMAREKIEKTSMQESEAITVILHLVSNHLKVNFLF